MNKEFKVLDIKYIGNKAIITCMLKKSGNRFWMELDTDEIDDELEGVGVGEDFSIVEELTHAAKYWVYKEEEKMKVAVLSNCEYCIHKGVCSLQRDYLTFQNNLQLGVDNMKGDNFEVQIRCKEWRVNQNSRREGVLQK